MIDARNRFRARIVPPGGPDRTQNEETAWADGSAPGPVRKTADMAIELRNSDKLPAPAGYSHASIAPAGRIVHLAGQIGIDADGNHPDGLAAQTKQALLNLVDALTGSSDGTVDDLAKLTAYVVGWKQSMQGELFRGMAEAAAVNPLPLVPITLVGVQSLFLDESLIEIEGVAVVI